MELALHRAPALHLQSKVLYGPCDEARAMAKAARMVKGTREASPVMFGGRIIGSVVDLPGNGVFTTKDDLSLAGFPNGYPDILKAIHLGQTFHTGIQINLISQSSTHIWSDCYPVLATSYLSAYSGTAYTARQFNNTSDGAIYQGPAVAPLQKYLHNYMFSEPSTGITPGNAYWLYDRVLAYDECGITGTSQTMTNTLTAQRWNTAALGGLRTLMSNGQVATGATASNLTGFSYQDENNASSPMPLTNTCPIRVSSNPVNLGGVSSDNLFYLFDATPSFQASLGPFLPLAYGDIGQLAINAYLTSASNTGTICFVMMKPLCLIIGADASTNVYVECWRDRIAPVRVYDDACLSLMLFGLEIARVGANFTFVYN